MLKVYIIHSQQLKLMIKSQFEHNDKLVRRAVVSPGCMTERYILNLLDCNMTSTSDKETSYQNYSILRISIQTTLAHGRAAEHITVFISGRSKAGCHSGLPRFC